MQRAQVRAPVQQVGGEAVPQPVRTDAPRIDAGDDRILLHQAPETAARGRFAVHFEEQRRERTFVRQLRARLREVALEPVLRLFAQRHHALAQGKAIAAGVAFSRELGNLPPNICNPGYLAQQAQEFAARFPLADCEVLGRDAMRELGMGSLLAVAQGSANEPKLIALKYNNGGDAKPYVLVGKGITFDTGGINLKTQGGIEEMKYDMCGAATVMGTFVAAVGMQLPINLVVIVPAVENMPDADAYRPSDVLTSMSGKTIEVGNTDAEGRLILCDALTYAQRFEPQALVDVATLTGA